MNSNWTLEHWMNLGLFVATLAFTGLGTVETWDQVPLRIGPPAVATFALSVLTFVRTMYTQKPRDPNVGERRSDPNPTIPVVENHTRAGKTITPAVVENPGRPLEDQPPKDKP